MVGRLYTSSSRFTKVEMPTKTLMLTDETGYEIRFGECGRHLCSCRDCAHVRHTVGMRHLLDSVKLVGKYAYSVDANRQVPL